MKLRIPSTLGEDPTAPQKLLTAGKCFTSRADSQSLVNESSFGGRPGAAAASPAPNRGVLKAAAPTTADQVRKERRLTCDMIISRR